MTPREVLRDGLLAEPEAALTVADARNLLAKIKGAIKDGADQMLEQGEDYRTSYSAPQPNAIAHIGPEPDGKLLAFEDRRKARAALAAAAATAATTEPVAEAIDPRAQGMANVAALSAEAFVKSPRLTRAVLAMEAGELSTKRKSKKLRAAMKRDVERRMKATSRFWRNNPGAAKQAAHKAVQEAMATR